MMNTAKNDPKTEPVVIVYADGTTLEWDERDRRTWPATIKRRGVPIVARWSNNIDRKRLAEYVAEIKEQWETDRNSFFEP